MLSKSVVIKAELLSNGINIDESVLNNYGYPYLEKRRAYGNQDPLSFRDKTIPQELYILPDKIICAVNVKHDAKRTLKYDKEYYISDGIERVQVDFPHRPDFYDYKMSNGKSVSQIITLYGGSTLGLFVYGSCNFIDQGKGCSYCSLKQNRSKGTDFVPVIAIEDAKEALELALGDKKANIKQIMINGGNFADLDKGFMYYVSLVESLMEVVKRSGRNLDIHLIVAPPNKMGLIEKLNGLDISIAINTEVFDEKLFEMHCPGKQIDYPHNHIFEALKKCVSVLGKNRVYSIFVGGLESLESMNKGLEYLSSIGVTPVINVLHTDPETRLESYPNPTVDYIIKAGINLQNIYTKYNMKPFYENCGRNSIDSESYCKMFY